jgi:AbrB family looped-hinge helix DNA binding protein
MLDVARLSVKGQVTIPVEIRRHLGLKGGDKVAFMEKDDNIVLLNSNRLAFEGFQRDMAGEAKKAGLNSEQDVVNLVKQVRGEMWEAQRAGDA